jgi:C1A family cysteine protease
MPYRSLGAIPDTFDPRDVVYEHTVAMSFAAPPPSVDMRNLCSPVRDQGHIGSCTGFAIGSGLREFLEIKSGKPNPEVELSPLFIYYEERKIEGTINTDAGARIRDGLKVLAKMGVCPETDDPYPANASTLQPNDPVLLAAIAKAPAAKALSDDKNFKINTFQRITTLFGLKQALAQGNGCVLGVAVYESFESSSAQKTGHIPIPKPNEQLLGGHALFCCGYKDDASYPGGGYLIVKNSWGTGFGDKGYIYLPYDYVSPKLISDIWTAAL